MIPFLRKKVTLTLQQMMNIQHRFNKLRLENEELRLLLQEAYTHIEVLKKERGSLNTLRKPAGTADNNISNHTQNILRGQPIV